ncbi:MAG: hypothetical protein OHK0056_25070 [Bacteriovoracaceae bacterium]
MLLGLHIGDSLGASLEFGPPRDRSNFHRDITGGGAHNWPAGAATDDTELMIELLMSLIETEGKFNIYDFSGRLMEWMVGEPADIGKTTFMAISRMMEGLPPKDWPDYAPNTQGNGSLMRVAPMVFFPYDFELVKKQASVTHGHINCAVVDFIFLNALKDALNDVPKETIYKNAIKTAHAFDRDQVTSHLEQIPNLSWDALPTSGWCIHTLGAAFWALLKTKSFEEGLIEIVNRGDDSDSCGAVAGALLGAYYGLESIPERWLKSIRQKTKIKNLINQWDRNVAIL